MGLIFKQIFQFIKLLNSDTATNQIAAGIAMGFVLGMTPAFSLQTLVVFICIFLFRIQMGAAFLSAFFFKFAAYLLDPLFDQVGAIVLSQEGLKPIFTTLYNMPIIPFTRFNNTIVMGSGVVTLASFPVVFILARILVSKYRQKVVEKFKESKLWKAVKATSLYKWYYKYDELYG
ncbi:MAG: TIGR03546 family protein [Bdellovibrionaceae bacterium]|nr:TIGR03546 family protein [Pseudobdellovibrionaceae bacterium]